MSTGIGLSWPEAQEAGLDRNTDLHASVYGNTSRDGNQEPQWGRTQSEQRVKFWTVTPCAL